MDYRSLLTDFPSGAQKDLLIRDVENSKEKFSLLLELTLFDKDPCCMAGGMDPGWKR